VGGRALSYLSVRRGRPPAFYEGGRGTTWRYAGGGQPTGVGVTAWEVQPEASTPLNMGVLKPTALGSALRQERAPSRIGALRRASARRHCVRGGRSGVRARVGARGWGRRAAA